MKTVRKGAKMLKEMIKNFCKEHAEYTFEADYCSVTADASNCIGVSLSCEHSYMEMLWELTAYLDRHGFEDVDLELSNPAIDELTDMVVVYFPYIHQ